MADIVLMPQLGISEESAVLASWNVKKGDEVKISTRLFTLETGKASFEVESEFSGTVLELLCEEGDELPIKAPVCVIGTPGESYELPNAEKKAEAEPQEEKAKGKIDEPAYDIVHTAGETHAASPRARALAEKAKVDISNIAASGPEGRIIERDVKAYLDAGRPEIERAETVKGILPTDYTERKFTRMRKVIADNMHASLSNSAQLTLNSSFDASDVLGFRKMAKAGVLKGFENVTIGDLILFAVSRTLLDFPYINAHCLDDKIREFNTVNLAVACDTPKGLMVPVIWHAEKLSLPEMSKKVKELAAACNAGTILPDDLTGGSFTVTNLGNLGIESFTPVINPPQTGILGVDCPVTKLKEKDGQLSVYTAMGLSLTFDHRAVDGAPAAKFLKALCEKLENIQSIIGTGKDA